MPVVSVAEGTSMLAWISSLQNFNTEITSVAHNSIRYLWVRCHRLDKSHMFLLLKMFYLPGQSHVASPFHSLSGVLFSRLTGHAVCSWQSVCVSHSLSEWLGVFSCSSQLTVYDGCFHSTKPKLAPISLARAKSTWNFFRRLWLCACNYSLCHPFNPKTPCTTQRQLAWSLKIDLNLSLDY